LRRFLLAAPLAASATSALAAPPALRLDVATATAARSALVRPMEVAMAAPMRRAPAGTMARVPAAPLQVAQGEAATAH
jgi:hypothetical protein